MEAHPERCPRLFMVEVEVADRPRALRWYTEVLMIPRLIDDPAHGFALLGGGGCMIALKERPVRKPGVNGAAPRLTFEVSDVDVERKRLLGLGQQVGDVIDNPREEYREVRLADPDGTPISLFSFRGGITPTAD